MHDEYNELVKNGTWILVPRLAGINFVRSMWLFKHKFHADGTLSRYKSHLVAGGSSQQLGIEYDDTFSPVVKPATIRTVLSLAVSHKWPIHQLDVKNTFLNGDLSETVYMHQPQALWTPGTLTKLGFSDLQVMSLVLDFTIAVVTLLYSFFVRDLRPDISYAVQQIFLYMHDPREPHLTALKHADWAGCPSTRRSTLGYCVFLGDNLLSWSSMCQQTISHSSAEAEYQGVANVVAETTWLRNLLRELHSPLSATALVYCDNVSTTYLSANHVQHQRTKHIEIDIHFVRDLVTAGQVRVLHVPSRYQAINEDERLARAINGLCDGLTTTIKEKQKYILPPLQRRWEYHTIRQREDELTGEFMKRFLRLDGFIGKKAGPPEEKAKHFKWPLCDWILDGIVNTEFTDVAQPATRNNNPKGYDQRRSDGRGYDRQNNNQRDFGQRGNNGRGYDRQGGNNGQKSYQLNRNQQYNRSFGSSS
nr:ribonuclease H-like domain-containing protein [Tanacetum cinerariifolium]